MCLFAMALILFSCNSTHKNRPDLGQYQFKETKDLVSFVTDAAELFSHKGMAVLKDFGDRNGKWFSEARYIFIYDMQGNCVFHPVIKEVAGKNLFEHTDLNGKPIIKIIINIASNKEKPYGWLHYLWAEPGEIFPSWKHAYIVGVKGTDGKTYAVGSGTYSIRTETKFVIDIVDSAAELVSEKGEEAYSRILDPASEFYFYNTYVFVLSTQGILLADPSFPENRQRDVMDLKDAEGHFVIHDLLKKLKEKDKAYVPYMWPAPGQINPSKKLIYARKVLSGSDTVIVGSSLFLMDAIWKKF